MTKVTKQYKNILNEHQKNHQIKKTLDMLKDLQEKGIIEKPSYNISHDLEIDNDKIHKYDKNYI